MEISSKCPRFWALTLLFFLIFSGIFLEFSIFSQSDAHQIEPNLDLVEIPQLMIFQENTLIPSPNPANPEPEKVWKMRVVVTAYSSTPWETDGNPFLTAAGTWVKEGIVANNMLPFGTKIKIPELYGDKVFVVEDRMSWAKDNHHIDIWFPDYWQALSFGVKRTYIEILEN